MMSVPAFCARWGFIMECKVDAEMVDRVAAYLCDELDFSCCDMWFELKDHEKGGYRKSATAILEIALKPDVVATRARQAKIKEWLGTMRGPDRPKPAPYVFGAKGTIDTLDLMAKSVIGFPAESLLGLSPAP